MENSNATDISAKTPTLEQNTKMLVVKDICAKWSHFSEQDVADFFQMFRNTPRATARPTS